jgi:DNA-directed RNA polymerase subunit RPC12/RpoP
MNILDATCKECGKEIRWLSGNPRLCQDCYHKILQASAQSTTVDAHGLSEKKEVGG